MNPIKVEVGQYREVNKGALKAFFTLIEYPYGRKTLDCRYFEIGENRWFTFPHKEIKSQEGHKSDYIPLVSYLDKEYQDQLKIAVLKALKTAKPQAQNEKSQNYSQTRPTNPLPAQSSPDPDGLPF